MKIFILALLFVSVSSLAHSQIVNIESKRLRTDTAGWAGEAEANFLLLKEASTVYAVDGTIRLQYKKDKSLLLFLTNFGFIKAGGEKFSNSGFQHIRYNYKVTPQFLRWEIFAQGQYNSIRDIKFRGLIGSGPRVKLLETKHLQMYLASLYMYEYEEAESERSIERTSRLSSYFSYTADVGLMHWSGTVYHQPAITDFSDYRISFQTDLEFGIFKSLKFITSYKLLYDTRPPPDITTTSYALSQGLKLEL